jgi:hypothetical protein
MCMQKSRVKTLLTVFFDSKRIIHKEFLPEGQTVNSDYYLGVLIVCGREFLEFDLNIESKVPGRSSTTMPHLHDNAPPHKSKIIWDSLARKGITVLDHPPYLSDGLQQISGCSQKLSWRWKETAVLNVIPQKE